MLAFSLLSNRESSTRTMLPVWMHITQTIASQLRARASKGKKEQKSHEASLCRRCRHANGAVVSG